MRFVLCHNRVVVNAIIEELFDQLWRAASVLMQIILIALT